MTSARSDRERATYIERSPRSRAVLDEARRYLPDGVTRGAGSDPYPLFWDRGRGCRIWDVDGIERIDFFGNNRALPLGHAHPAVVAALEEWVAKGVSFNAPHEAHVRLARILCERLESVEMVRFTNSGTEATMNCVHVARAFTGRAKIAKVDGAYHGLYDAVAFDGADDGNLSPSPNLPAMAHSMTGQVVVLPFNEAAAAREKMLEHRDELAAVIVEPMMGAAGFIQAEPEYLRTLRETTAQNGILLIFDEVCSLRAGPGALQLRRSGPPRRPLSLFQRQSPEHGQRRGDLRAAYTRSLPTARPIGRTPARGDQGGLWGVRRPGAGDWTGLSVRRPFQRPPDQKRPRFSRQRRRASSAGLPGTHERGHLDLAEPHRCHFHTDGGKRDRCLSGRASRGTGAGLRNCCRISAPWYVRSRRRVSGSVQAAGFWSTALSQSHRQKS